QFLYNLMKNIYIIPISANLTLFGLLNCINLLELNSNLAGQMKAVAVVLAIPVVLVVAVIVLFSDDYKYTL
ncbi:232_t:CDS:2, partial [Funneliformis geosporum]